MSAKGQAESAFKCCLKSVPCEKYERIPAMLCYTQDSWHHIHQRELMTHNSRIHSSNKVQNFMLTGKS